ncbi:MAG: hypothetical protein N2517_07090 [Ignavibacteria bacterium]|nr:hypothetical protein [Ignavibacteria bacterium]
MKLLLLINGNATTIIERNNFNTDEFEIVKVDEKKLAKPKFVLELIRKNYEFIYFGCADIEFQRFQPFMQIYILLSKSKKGGIIDELGRKIKFSLFKTIFVVIPKLILEAVLSILIVGFSYLYYFYWRKFKIKLIKK